MARTTPERPLQVLVLAPVGRDARLLCEALGTAGIAVEPVSSAAELIDRVAEEVSGDRSPRLGALVVTDEALAVDWSARLVDVLDRQPSWSDLPLVLLAGSSAAGDADGGEAAGSSRPLAQRFTVRGSVTVLDRPVRTAALVSAVRAAIRNRARQMEVRELLEAKANAQAEAERANRAKSEFLAVMSHELRTPLNAIAGYADLMAMEVFGGVTAEQRDALERIQRAQRHLLGIINDLLNYARLEGGRVEYTIRPVVVADVLAEVGPLMEPLLHAKGVCYEAILPPRDVVAAADAEKLRQILLNLLSNAVKFTRAGGRVEIEVVERADATQPPDAIYLRVTDTGVGIPADKLDTIFDPFVQIRTRDGPAREGTGLGLAISRDLARGMGGDLRARSVLGMGSTFTLELRRAEEGRELVREAKPA